MRFLITCKQLHSPHALCTEKQCTRFPKRVNNFGIHHCAPSIWKSGPKWFPWFLLHKPELQPLGRIMVMFVFGKLKMQPMQPMSDLPIFIASILIHITRFLLLTESAWDVYLVYTDVPILTSSCRSITCTPLRMVPIWNFFVFVHCCLNSLTSSLITPTSTPRSEASRTRAVTRGQVNSGLALLPSFYQVWLDLYFFLAAEWWNTLPAECGQAPSLTEFLSRT